jgi:pilus assembly protein CpaB
MPRLRRPRHPLLLLRRVLAALLAGGALVLALRPPGPQPATGPAPTRPVVVAAADLTPGAPLAAGDLAVARWPPGAVPDGSAGSADQLTGQVLAAPLRRGEPVTDVRVVGPRLWEQVPAGQVAAPVRLADLAVSSLLRPGDRVDVLSTAAEAPGAQVVAAGALVLTAPPPPAGDRSPGAADGGLLVLAVAPDTAARLAAAAADGTLTVTLGRP